MRTELPQNISNYEQFGTFVALWKAAKRCGEKKEGPGNLAWTFHAKADKTTDVEKCLERPLKGTFEPTTANRESLIPFPAE